MANLWAAASQAGVEPFCSIAVYLRTYVRGGFMSTVPATTSAPAFAHQAYDYAVVDVFAEQPLAGNALAVFADARGLSTSEMQSIARETNLSETTFILPRPPEVERERGVQARIFTAQEDLEFAGHPTLGTAGWVYLNPPTLLG